MVEYSATIRARALARMMGPNAVEAATVWKETGISQATLCRWKQEAGMITTVPSKRAPKPEAVGRAPKSEPGERAPTASKASKQQQQQRSGPDKLALVVRAEGLEGDALGAFLRREGIHFAELERWRKQAAEALSDTPRHAPSTELRNLRAELARKEKALAEIAALIVLKKKVGQILGDEDDDTEPPSD
jgi:transposase